MKKFENVDFDALGKFLVGDKPADEKEKDFWEKNCENFMKEYEKEYNK